MDKGKRPASSSSEALEAFTGRRPWRQVPSEAEKLRFSQQRENEKFVGKMRRRKNKEERKGKDWVESKEEWLDLYGINHPLFNAYFDKCQLIKDKYRWREITDSQRDAALEENYAEYEAKKKELEDLEDAEYAQDDDV